MRHVIARRLLLSLPVLMGVLLIGFMLLVVVPSDPAAIIAGEGATAEIIAAIRHNLGLDRPVLVQFLLYLLRVLHGDLGNSIFNKAPVIDELLRTIGPTCELMAVGCSWPFQPASRSAQFRRRCVDAGAIAPS